MTNNKQELIDSISLARVDLNSLNYDNKLTENVESWKNFFNGLPKMEIPHRKPRVTSKTTVKP